MQTPKTQAPLPLLTRDNYYSREADLAYMSCSQFQDFLDCEARTMAELEGRFDREDSEAFLVGNYFHSFFESPDAHEQFCKEHLTDVFKTKVDKLTGDLIPTGKYAPYEKADVMIDAILNDEFCMEFVNMPGENEKIITGTLFGVPWKIRLDKYIPDGRLIIDYKTCKSLCETNWNPFTRQRETFIETYGYMRRAAVYSEIEKQWSKQTSDPPFILICASKEDPPDKDCIGLNHRVRYDMELDFIRERLPHIMAVKNHQIAPTKCGTCKYCRSVKKVTDIKPYFKLMPEYRETREDDTESDFYQVQTP